MADNWFEDRLFTDEPNPEVFDPQAFHQPGFLPFGILDQDQFWVDRAGRLHELRSMSPAFCANVLNALRAYANVLSGHAAVGEMLNSSLGTLVAMAAYGVPFVCELEPEAWLTSTPLVRALQLRQADPA